MRGWHWPDGCGPPLEFGHNFLYIACTLAQTLALTRLTEPFWWFVLSAFFSALVWGLFIYDVIRAFIKIAPLIAEARHDWRSAETSEAGPEEKG